MLAAFARNAEIIGAVVEVVAVRRGIHTAQQGVAGVVGTDVVIVAVNLVVLAPVVGIANVCGAGVAIDAVLWPVAAVCGDALGQGGLGGRGTGCGAVFALGTSVDAIVEDLLGLIGTLVSAFVRRRRRRRAAVRNT
jgi:hypothetical protein